MKKLLGSSAAPIIVGATGIAMIIWAQFHKKTVSLSFPSIGIMPMVIVALLLLLALSFHIFGFWLQGTGKASAKAAGTAFDYAAPKVGKGVSHVVSGFQANPIFYTGAISFGAALVMLLVAITTGEMLPFYGAVVFLGVSICAFITYYQKWGTITSFLEEKALPFIIAHKVAIWCIASIVALVWAITSGGSLFVITLSGVSTVASIITIGSWWGNVGTWALIFFKAIGDVMVGGKGKGPAAFVNGLFLLLLGFWLRGFDQGWTSMLMIAVGFFALISSLALAIGDRVNGEASKK